MFSFGRVRDDGEEGALKMLRPCSGDDVLYPSDRSPIPGEPASHKTEPNSPICALGPSKNLKSEKRYLGVRVRMPVRDMLRKIRIAKGMDPLKKRVHSSRYLISFQNEKQIRSLEDLSIIVEVLEEDLKASKSREHSREPSSTSVFSGWQEGFRGENFPFQNSVHKCEHGSKPFFPEKHCHPPELSAVYSFSPAPISTVDLAPSSKMWGGCYTDSMEDVFSNTQPLTTLSNRSNEWQEFSPQAPQPYSPTSHTLGGNKEKGWNTCGDWMSVSLQHERLHSAVTQGKRALAFVIAKRMASLNHIDIRDVEGKTALHLSAQRNQHLMIADLLFLGANVNAQDRCGKTCLHLSAENGYFRVLEVLRHSMNDGLYVDVDATDMNGLTALQCAIAALNTCVLELERSVNPSLMRLHTLRKEQLLDTLDSLLHMGSCLESLIQRCYSRKRKMVPKQRTKEN
uniref:Zgc:113279 n=1 Tax=Scleropages formosus TaxID=113540 RepID=A0A8C9R0Q8_SCLFO